MPFTLVAAQITAIRGDIAQNILMHQRFMEQAAREGADLLVFPELSVTGYEMDLAADLQTDVEDHVFAPLQTLAREAGMLTMVGMPVRAESGKPYLGSFILGGDAPVAYNKIHVHASEAEYFQPADAHVVVPHKGRSVGFAICADLNHASHAAGACVAGADVYAVGALINSDCWPRERPMLAGYARDHSMTVVLANYASKSGPLTPVGHSSIWAPGGALVAQTDGTEEALIIGKESDQGWRGQIVRL